MGQLWTVPHRRNPAFTGRGDELTLLHAQLSERGLAILSGLGGIGKTQMAVEYAFRHRDDYAAVLWFNAESRLMLKMECSALVRTLKLPCAPEDLDQAELAVLEWLRNESGWLLILDNADNPAELDPFPPAECQGHVIVTSRSDEFQHLQLERPLRLAELPIEDATTFLLTRCQRQDAGVEEQASARLLAEELGRLPLALEQAGAYILARDGTTFEGYLSDYRKLGLRRLEASRPALGKYSKSVVTTWKASFDAVQAESPAAADVLQLTAFLAPEAIPFELLIQGATQLGASIEAALDGAAETPSLVGDLLRPLERYSLVRIDSRDEMYRIHRLVQEVLRAAMDDTTRRHWAERSVRSVHRAFPSPEFPNWPLCDRILRHALAVIPRIELDDLVFAEAGRLLNKTAYYLNERAQYADAEPLYKQVMEIRRAALGERHPDYASSLNNLAALYDAMGRHADAEPLLKESTEIRRAALGERHPDYAQSLNNLAQLYRAMGRHADAEPLCKQASAIWREALGERHPSYAISLNNLAALYRDMGRHTEAEPLLKQAMEIRRAALGERHPDHAQSLNNLAVLYGEMARHAEAEPLHKESTEILRAALGERHPDYAGSLYNLASLYQAIGRHAEAELQFRQALEILRTTLGTEHPNYRTVLTRFFINQRDGKLSLPKGELLRDLLALLASMPEPEVSPGDDGISDAEPA